MRLVVKVCLAEGEPSQSSFSNWSGFLWVRNTTDRYVEIQLSTQVLVTGFLLLLELYFSFTNAYGIWKSNPGLKSERSINHTLFAKAQNEKVCLILTYIKLVIGISCLNKKVSLNKLNMDGFTKRQRNQMVNVGNARVSGIEVKEVLI